MLKKPDMFGVQYILFSTTVYQPSWSGMTSLITVAYSWYRISCLLSTNVGGILKGFLWTIKYTS